jgi:hypothetical protein
MGFAPNWQVPYSAKRLLELCKTWSFKGEVDDLPDLDDGEPRDCRAARRLDDAFRAWRDRHAADDDPMFDDTEQLFHVCDVAIILEECHRLWRLEEKVIDALGPETVKQRWNKKKGKFEPE